MSSFKFSQDDLKSFTPAAFTTQQNAQNPNPKAGLSTSNSKLGASNEGDLEGISTLDIGTTLMGIPMYKDPSQIASNTDYLQSSLLASALGGSKQNLGAFNLITPPDVLAQAQVVANVQKAQGTTADPANPNSPPSSSTLGTGDPKGIVAYAATLEGKPYVYGATGPNSFDCSGLLVFVFAHFGVSLPRTSQEQFATGQNIGSAADAQPADCVFFNVPSDGGTQPGHVGIYVGGGQMIAAPHTGTVVQQQSINGIGAVMGFRRYIQDNTAAAAPVSVSPNGTVNATVNNAGAGTSNVSGANGNINVSIGG